jgi:hypothetical protein
MCSIGRKSSPSSTGQYSSGGTSRRMQTSAARKPSQNSHCGISSLLAQQVELGVERVEVFGRERAGVGRRRVGQSARR